MTVAKTEIYFATRKTASAHVYIAKGTGIVRVNNVPIEMMGAESARETVLAPLEIAGDLRDKVDISVRTRGGGFMGQSGAAATAISRALVGWTKSKKEPKGHPLSKSIREDLRKRLCRSLMYATWRQHQRRILILSASYHSMKFPVFRCDFRCNKSPPVPDWESWMNFIRLPCTFDSPK